MRIILLGPPGSGKGTQAQLLCRQFGMAHIGTGDILREAVRGGAPLGLQAKGFMDRGQFVPDTLVNDLVAERFDRPDRPATFLVEGYPRNLTQAKAFDQVLRRNSLELDAVLLFEVPDEEIVYRVSGRRICPKCNSLYHVVQKPPKQDDRCDHCLTPLELRTDDRAETVRDRLLLFHQTITAILDYYRQSHLLREINGLGPIDGVFRACLRSLGVETPHAEEVRPARA
jgi:adenylate kinase